MFPILLLHRYEAEQAALEEKQRQAQEAMRQAALREAERVQRVRLEHSPLCFPPFSPLVLTQHAGSHLGGSLTIAYPLFAAPFATSPQLEQLKAQTQAILAEQAAEVERKRVRAGATSACPFRPARPARADPVKSASFLLRARLLCAAVLKQLCVHINLFAHAT